MAMYADKKSEALGLILPAPDPFATGTVFDVPLSMGTMTGSGHITNFEKLFKEEIDEQSKLREMLEFKWDAEYAADRKDARKNLDKLNECLLAGDYDKTVQLFAHKPAADWLNYVFLDTTEVSDLMVFIKKTTPECRDVIDVAITKELKRLVNFKMLFELIKKTSLSC